MSPACHSARSKNPSSGQLKVDNPLLLDFPILRLQHVIARYSSVRIHITILSSYSQFKDKDGIYVILNDINVTKIKLIVK